jgi:hypothetical protein
MKLKSIFTYSLLLLAWITQAQVTTAIDSTQRKIGAQFNLTLKATADTSAKVTFPSARNFGAMEVIRNYKVDTVRQGKTHQLVKRYGLTQFDSGSYLIPALKVTIDKKVFLTDSIRVSVQPVKVDTLKQGMHDIRDIIREGESSGMAWWKYLLIALFVIAAGFGIWWLIKNNKAKKVEPEDETTPIEKANTLLQALEQKQLLQKGEIKTYYSELTDIARTYIEEAIHIPAMESTTSELILGLRAAADKKHMNVAPDILEDLERVLRQADLVKFAKNRPSEAEISGDRKKIGKVLVELDQAIPQQLEDEEDALARYQLEREEFLRKRARRKKIGYGIASAVILIVGAMVLFVVIKGAEGARDAIFGNPTKELLEGEWVSSEYGNPPVLIETPRVLTRIKQTDSTANINRQKFKFSEVGQPIDILLMTMRFADDAPIDDVLKRSVDEIPQMLATSLAAQNITVKSDPFKSRTNQEGVKTFGNMKIKHPVTGQQTVVAYEVATFVQPGGMTQLLLIYSPQDQNIQPIVSRIFDSIELKMPLK